MAMAEKVQGERGKYSNILCTCMEYTFLIFLMGNLSARCVYARALSLLLSQHAVASKRNRANEVK